MDEQSARIALNVFPGIGPVRFQQIRQNFNGALGFWTAGESELRTCGLPEALISQFLTFRRKFRIAPYLDILKHKGITALTSADSRYPSLLKEIPDAPFVLYALGDTGFLESVSGMPALAVVGTRKMTPYGRSVTEQLSGELSRFGFVIVSGMAYGVDAVAHASALSSGGRTIAVLGCGADVIAPPGNTGLYHEIIQSGRGLILSEMPIGMRPNKGLFPVRNRLISGLSLGVLVTEGSETSGSLITAKYASEQGREVFAVPGPVNRETSRGPSILIKQGAKLVESVSDILEELNVPVYRKESIRSGVPLDALAPDEQSVADFLAGGQQPVDEMIRGLGMPPERVISALTQLEVHGIVKSCGDTIYELILR